MKQRRHRNRPGGFWRLAAAVLTFCLLLAAVGPIPAFAKEVQWNGSWDGFENGDTLSLEGATVSGQITIPNRITKLTVAGKRSAFMGKVSIDFEEGHGPLDLTIQDLWITGQKDMYAISLPKETTLTVKGECRLTGGMGETYGKKNHAIYSGIDEASLKIVIGPGDSLLAQGGEDQAVTENGNSFGGHGISVNYEGLLELEVADGGKLTAVGGNGVAYAGFGISVGGSVVIRGGGDLYFAGGETTAEDPAKGGIGLSANTLEISEAAMVLRGTNMGANIAPIGDAAGMKVGEGAKVNAIGGQYGIFVSRLTSTAPANGLELEPGASLNAAGMKYGVVCSMSHVTVLDGARFYAGGNYGVYTYGGGSISIAAGAEGLAAGITAPLIVGEGGTLENQADPEAFLAADVAEIVLDSQAETRLDVYESEPPFGIRASTLFANVGGGMALWQYSPDPSSSPHLLRLYDVNINVQEQQYSCINLPNEPAQIILYGVNRAVNQATVGGTAINATGQGCDVTVTGGGSLCAKAAAYAGIYVYGSFTYAGTGSLEAQGTQGAVFTGEESGNIITVDPPAGRSIRVYAGQSAGDNALAGTFGVRSEYEAGAPYLLLESEETTLHTLTVVGGTDLTNAGPYAAGANVKIKADAPKAGERFGYWSSDSSIFADTMDIFEPETTIVMTEEDVTVTAVFEETAAYPLTVVGGTDLTNAGPYEAGAKVRIKADAPDSGMKFSHWTAENSDHIEENGVFQNASSSETTLTMPEYSLTVTAHYEKQKTTPKTGPSGSYIPSGKTTYGVVYHPNYAGGGTDVTDGGYQKGDTVTIKDGGIFSAPAGMIFAGWSEAAYGEPTRRAGESFEISARVDLYAQWQPLPSLNSEDHIAYLSGYPDGTIQPGSDITRAEVAAVFFRLLSEESRSQYQSGELPFSDVQGSYWAAGEIAVMARAGILKGEPGGGFAPDRQITRAEFAAVAARFDSAAYSGADLFPDIAGHWAANEINRAAQKGWVTGMPDGGYEPERYITRAEAATLINRVLERLPETAADLLGGMKTWPDNADPQAWFYLAVQEASNAHLYEKKADGVHESWTGLK